MKEMLLLRFLPNQSVAEMEFLLLKNTPYGEKKTYWFRSPEKDVRVIWAVVENNLVSWQYIGHQ
jgi:hypothetical protein